MARIPVFQAGKEGSKPSGVTELTKLKVVRSGDSNMVWTSAPHGPIAKICCHNAFLANLVIAPA